MNADALDLILLFLLLFGVAALVYWQRVLKKAPPALLAPRPSSFAFLKFEEIVPFNRAARTLDRQSPFWRDKMLFYGRAMRKANVKAVFFTHGTFTGNDPLGIVRFLKVVYPNLPPNIEARIRAIIRKNNNRFLRDSGNFTPEYVAFFSKALGGIPCHEFVWSSENHHVGRLRSAIILGETLAQHVEAHKLTANDRILLIGHSHAGQLFALLSLLFHKDDVAKKIMSALDPNMAAAAQLAVAALQKVKLDFVTYGMPVRYPWGESCSKRLLNIVNHRGDSYLAGQLRGMLHTRGGDYIQQLGLIGSDLLASHKGDRILNRQLDEILGVGSDVRIWTQELRRRPRVSPFGHTLLVDYLDGAKAIPNGALTLFGHGIYTRHDSMLFNMSLIVNHFYL